MGAVTWTDRERDRFRERKRKRKIEKLGCSERKMREARTMDGSALPEFVAGKHREQWPWGKSGEKERDGGGSLSTSLVGSYMILFFFFSSSVFRWKNQVCPSLKGLSCLFYPLKTTGLHI